MNANQYDVCSLNGRNNSCSVFNMNMNKRKSLEMQIYEINSNSFSSSSIKSKRFQFLFPSLFRIPKIHECIDGLDKYFHLISDCFHMIYIFGLKLTVNLIENHNSIERCSFVLSIRHSNLHKHTIATSTFTLQVSELVSLAIIFCSYDKPISPATML